MTLPEVERRTGPSCWRSDVIDWEIASVDLRPKGVLKASALRSRAPALQLSHRSRQGGALR